MFSGEDDRDKVLLPSLEYKGHRTSTGGCIRALMGRSDPLLPWRNSLTREKASEQIEVKSRGRTWPERIGAISEKQSQHVGWSVEAINLHLKTKQNKINVENSPKIVLPRKQVQLEPFSEMDAHPGKKAKQKIGEEPQDLLQSLWSPCSSRLNLQLYY